MDPKRLVTMANEIAAFFASYGEDEAIAGTAGHIKAFWDPRMRRAISEHVAAGGEGLSPIALAALKRLPPPAAS